MSNYDSSRSRSQKTAFSAFLVALVLLGLVFFGDRIDLLSAIFGVRSPVYTEEGDDRRFDDVPSSSLKVPAEEFAQIAETMSNLMVRVRAGTFVYGATEKQKKEILPDLRLPNRVKVTLTRDFEMGIDEVPLSFYNLVVDKPIAQAHYWAACENQPCSASGVSWYDAVQFTNRLNEILGLEPCYDDQGELLKVKTPYECTGYRLPTSAEWEYIARAGSRSRLPKVDKAGTNAWGFRRTLGGVTEWVYDRPTGANLEVLVDPVSLSTETAYRIYNQRQTRGSYFTNWANRPDSIFGWHVSAIQGVEALSRAHVTGIRLARTIHR